MKDPALHALWLRHLEGERLESAARQQLAAALAADPQALAQALTDLRLDAQLRTHLRLGDDDPAFVATVLRQCGYVGDSARFARTVERRLPRPMTRRGRSSRPVASRRWWPAVAVIGAAAAILVLLWGRPAAPPADAWTVVAVAGAPTTASGPIAVGHRLMAETRLDGSAADRLHLEGDGMQIELVAAQAVVPSLRDPRWQLTRGLLDATVEARSHRAPFQVVTPHASAMVTGTRFTVTVTSHTHLAVAQGRVRFGHEGTWTELGAGEQAVLPEPEPEAAPPPDPAAVTDPRLSMPSLLAYYRFDEGAGGTVSDASGQGPVLQIIDPERVVWSDEGLRLQAGTQLLAPGPATHLNDACIAAEAISIEAEVTITAPPPFDTTVVGPARIVTLSDDTLERNATLGWGEIGVFEPALVLRLRQDGEGGSANGTPTHWIPAPPPGRVHVLVTYQAGIGARWYVNGREIPSRTWHYQRREALAAQGSLREWSRTARLALGGEVVADAEDGQLRTWLGTYHRVALYGGVIDPATALRLTMP